MDTIHLGELTWQEAKERLQAVDVALLPVGAVEQHGPHLPLDTDAFDAAHLAEQVPFFALGYRLGTDVLRLIRDA